MSQHPTLIVDDQSPAIRYLCPSRHQQVTGTYYNNTWSTVESDECQSGWFQYEFNGTAIGIAATVPTGETYSIKLDDGEFVAQSGDGSYNSPQLADGKHTITYAVKKGKGFSAPTFDYLTVTAGESTPLTGQTVAVDSGDAAIIYGGNWKASPPVDIPKNGLSLHLGTTQWTSSVGDTLRFQFSGTSVSVFGILANVTDSRNLTLAYTLDGKTSTQVIDGDTFQLLPMVKLLHGDVTPGDHTLSINITEITASQALGVDLITYNTTSTYAGSSEKAPVKTSGSSKVPLIGGLVGGLVAFFLLAGAFVFFYRRYRVRRQEEKHQKLNS